MESTHKERYLEAYGTKVVVTEEMFQVVFRQINRTRYVAHLEDRCGQPNFRKCKGDCGMCPYQKQGVRRVWFSYVSDEAACVEAVTQESAEDLLLREEMWHQVYKLADKAVEFGSEILRMRIEQQFSMKQIAQELGLTVSHVEYKLRRIYTVLKKHSEIFF